MDIEYFFYVDETAFRHLRPATATEQEWYHSLAQELQPYQKILIGLNMLTIASAL